ncbi:MAG: SURF1 family protein [Ehrlichia sp.]
MVFVIPFSIMVFLGTWQIFRLKEKNEIIHNMQVPATRLLTDSIIKQNYKNVVAEGTFDNNYRFFFFAGALGYYLLHPFHLSSGKYILVNKGVVSDKNLNIDLFDSAKINVHGILYCDYNKKVRWFVKNDMNANIWFWFDIENMSKQINIPLESCMIWADRTVAFNNVTANVPLKIRNDHLEYIVTWYLLALIWLIGCVYLFNRKKS